MNYKDMEMAQLEERKAAIAAEAEGMGSSPEDLDGLKALEEEMRAINEEIEARKAAEAERRELAEKIANGSGEVINEDPSTTEERKTKMDNLEVRNSREYIDAFANYIKTGSDAECRALLSDGAATGTVPIPEFVAGIVADLDDLLPHDGRDVEVGVGGYLSGDQDVTGAGYGLAGDAAQGVFSETGVEDGVADCVAEFVGVAFGHGF